MIKENFKRKLTAILSADVAGYSQLMGKDEEATVRTLTEYRGVMTMLIQKHSQISASRPGNGETIVSPIWPS